MDDFPLLSLLILDKSHIVIPGYFYFVLSGPETTNKWEILARCSVIKLANSSYFNDLILPFVHRPKPCRHSSNNSAVPQWMHRQKRNRNKSASIQWKGRLRKTTRRPSWRFVFSFRFHIKDDIKSVWIVDVRWGIKVCFQVSILLSEQFWGFGLEWGWEWTSLLN